MADLTLTGKINNQGSSSLYVPFSTRLVSAFLRFLASPAKISLGDSVFAYSVAIVLENS
jgi:hypothetical protein